MDWGKISRKLSLLALSVGVTISAVPGAASASSVQPKLTKTALTLLEDSLSTYVSPQINTKSSNDIRVIVQLSGEPAAVGNYAKKQGISSLASTATEATVNSQQNTVLKKASKAGLDLEVNYQYNTVLNGFEVTIPANEVPELAKIAGVKSIYPNSTWYAVPVEQDNTGAEVTQQNDNGPLEQIGATWAWAHNYTGQGLKVGVIDTGVDYTHPDIQPAYKGGYDSFYNDNDPYEEVPLSKDEDEYGVGYEGTYHGTHVAGTIIGQFANRSGEIAQKGVAYGADLYAYKVLGRNLEKPSTSSGSSAQVIDGIERAVKDGMDVINLSLGSDEEKDVNSPDAIAINNAVLSGVIAVIANGNEGPGQYTLGSPATSQLGISVGAVTSPSKHFNGKFNANLATPTATSVTYETYGDFDFNVMGWELGKEDFAGIVGTKPVEVVYAGLGYDKEYPSADVNGAIVLLSRGDLAFTDKVAKAKAHNARAVVIFNGNVKDGKVDLSESILNRDGFINSSLGDGFDNIPTFDMKGIEGRALARALVSSPGSHFYFTFGSNYNPSSDKGDVLASFTSWGPNVDSNLSIKPDFTAPGVGVLSTWPAYGKDDATVSYEKAYNRISGTSMATPHVAGLALLVKQAHPDWSPFDVRAALANTAEVIGDGDYTVYQQGAGRVDVEGAISTPALVQALEPITILDKNYQSQDIMNYNSSAGFGVVGQGGFSVKTLQLQNMSSSPLSYEASVEWHGDNPEEIAAVLSNTRVNVDGNKDSQFSLELKVADKAAEGFYEGQVNLTSPGQPNLHLPFSVYVGQQLPDSPVGLQELSLTNPLIYPNASLQNSTDLSFRLSAKDANYYEVDVVNMDDQTIGFIKAEGTDNPAEFFKPGVYTVKGIDGSYVPIKDKKPVVDKDGNYVIEHLKDGTYKIKILAAQLTKNGTIDEENPILYLAYTSFRVNNSDKVESTPAPGTGGGSAPVATPAPTATPVNISNSVIDQGLKQVQVTPAQTSAGGVTTATVTDDSLKAALASASTSPAAIIISLPSAADGSAKLALTSDQAKLLAAAPAKSVVVFNASGSAVSLPVSLLANAPAGASLELVIKKAEDQASKFTASIVGSSVIGTPVAIEANWVTASGSTALKVPNNVFIKRAFTVPGSIEPNTAGVLFEADGKITPVSSVFKKQADGTTQVTVSRPGFSAYAAVSLPVSFTDIDNSPAASDIKALANKLIINGTSATAFSPKSNLTRAEFTALLVRSLGLRATTPSSFTDVKAAAWYSGDVAAATEAGLILGIGNGKFAPDSKVSRQELAVILNRALKLTGAEVKAANPSFSAYTDDAKIAKYAKESVQSLSAAGVIGSDAGANFNPTGAATRETVAAGLHQLLIKAGLID